MSDFMFEYRRRAKEAFAAADSATQQGARRRHLDAGEYWQALAAVEASTQIVGDAKRGRPKKVNKP